MEEHIIFIFLDGVGLGDPGEKNPLVHDSMPFIREQVGGDLLKGRDLRRPRLLLKGIDATLDVRGIPQSATGQTSLFTGQNAAKILGYHLPAFPNEPLIEVINECSILKRVIDKGGTATFANAYTENYFKRVEQGTLSYSATTLCVLAAQLPFRFMPDLMRGEAVYWDVTNKHLFQNEVAGVSLVSPYLAGRRLSRLGLRYNLILFESFLPDLIGHRKNVAQAVEILNTLDLFIRGACENKEDHVSVLITSDHGNIEDLSTGAHTLNKVPLLVLGPLAERMVDVASITEVAEKVV
ncbi:MAG: phosphoglyceromutase [Kiritimatiellae bacterium]|nr:phosphoglyceromutase [Kiritimatiellia bacterium]